MSYNITILTRFIGSFDKLSSDYKPLLNVFTRRKNEEGLSVWDVTKYIKKNEADKIFNIGDKNFAKKPPHTIARCDLKRLEIDKVFGDIKKEIPNINYYIKPNFLNNHKEIRYSLFDNPSTEYVIARKLLDISKFEKHPTRLS